VVTLETDKELSPMLERAAAALWQHENPTMSVFACTAEIRNAYRKRALDGERAPEKVS
jgi:hypothetical protein